MNNKLPRIFLFTPPCSYSAIISADRGVKALGGISEKPRHTDCLADAHPFLKHAKKEIQVQPSCLCLVPWMVKARQCVCWRESNGGWAACVYVCVCLLSSVAFSRSARGFDSAAHSQIQLSAVFRCCGWYGNLLCVF